MEYDDVFSLVRNIFVDFKVIEKTYLKYNEKREKIILKSFNTRLSKYFRFAEISNLILGTSFIEDVWIIDYYIGDKVFHFKIDKNLEEITLKLTLDWYLNAIEAEKLRLDYQNRYKRIKNDLKSEIRDYKINRII